MAYTGKGSSSGISATLNVGGTVIDAYIVTVQESDAAAVDELKDGYGEVQGLYVRDKRRSVTLDVYPAAASEANAINAANIPSIPAKVTISNAKDAGGETVADLNADWVYSGGMSRAWSEGQVRLTIPLWRSTTGANANTLTTAIT